MDQCIFIFRWKQHGTILFAFPGSKGEDDLLIQVCFAQEIGGGVGKLETRESVSCILKCMDLKFGLYIKAEFIP